jgi:hypothetical protein
MRNFGPKKPGGPGGAAAAPYVPPPDPYKGIKDFYQEIADKGEDGYIFGPPPGITKTYQGHRNHAVPKLEPRMQVYAKKLRDFYWKEGIIN